MKKYINTLLDKKIKLGIKLMTYINITNKPPIYTKKSKYPYQEKVIIPTSPLTHKVTIININPSLRGWITIRQILLKENPTETINNKLISKDKY